MTEAKTGCRVWIDQTLCTGTGLCAETAPDVIVIGDTGMAYVKDERGVFDGTSEDLPAGAKGLAKIAVEHFDAVYDTAAACPNECIFIEDTQGNPVGPFAP